MTEPKILVLDVETKPALAYVWKLFDENISLDQLIEPSRIICFAARWVNGDETFFHADWFEGGRQVMLAALYHLMAQADAIVTFNGDKFDLTKIRGEFVAESIPPLPPITSIDLYKTVRKLGFQSGKLAFVGPFLGLGKKVKNTGFKLWADVLDGKFEAQTEMMNYCIGDVLLTEKLYMKLRPYITNHPHMGEDKAECGACGSNHSQSRGYRRTKAFKIQRLHCQSCGAWFDGKRSKV